MAGNGADRLRLVYMPVADLPPAKRNPKQHDIDDLVKSMKRWGFTQPELLDERTGMLVAGHGRKEALLKMQAAGDPPPARIRVKNGAWLVPVLRGIAFASDQEAEAYLLADNKLVEAGGWDAELEAQMLRDLSTQFGPEFLDGVGYGEAELAEMLHPETGGNTDPDDVPEPPKAQVTKPGDLWVMGDHRLLCGNSTKADNVARLMGDERAVLMNTDPPYGIDYAKVKNGIPGSGFRDILARSGDIANDTLTSGPELQEFLETAIRAALPHLSETCAFYLWHPMLTQGTFFAAAAAADILIHRQIVWVKPNMVLTRSGQYHWRHELCFYGWVRGKPCPWYGDKSQVSVWELGRQPGEDREGHPTQKPVELFAIPMRNHTRTGEICYEPFSGSGSQIVAAEMLGRRCFALELEPRYVDLAVARWEHFSGKKAVLERAKPRAARPKKPRITTTPPGPEPAPGS